DLTDNAERHGMSKEAAAAISPITYVDRDSAPLLLLHGEADQLVPMRQSEILLAKYKEAGASCVLEKNPGPHGFWNQDRFGESMDRAADFFREKLTAK